MFPTGAALAGIATLSTVANVNAPTITNSDSVVPILIGSAVAMPITSRYGGTLNSSNFAPKNKSVDQMWIDRQFASHALP